MTSTATILEPDVSSTSSIVNALIHRCLPDQVGPEHIIVISGTTHYTKETLYRKRRCIKESMTHFNIPYRLEFLLAQRCLSGLVCFWWHDGGDLEQKEWFDKNALQGRFPGVREESL